MATTVSAPTVSPIHNAIPASLLNACFALVVVNAVFFPTAFSAHWWIFGDNSLGIPTDFVNVWSAGRLVLDGHPAQAYDWDIQKQVQVAVLGQSYEGNFAWHYPPPFLFVATLLAHSGMDEGGRQDRPAVQGRDQQARQQRQRKPDPIFPWM
jgi:arabinofuranan 3-O-arabinosyltransferase